MILLLLLSIFLHQVSSDQSASFSFPSFNNKSCSVGNLICSGSVTAYNGYLSLTSEPVSATSLPQYKVGRVLYYQPVLAWPAMISTTFTIRIVPYPKSSDSADGLTFIFAPDSNPSPSSSYGSNLGIIDPSSTGGNVSQLAVELDTFKNPFDIDGNHIGIVTNSTEKNLAVVSLNSTGIDLKSGKFIIVQIDYDGWNEMLYISVAYLEDPLQRILETPIVMSEKVPSSVYVGFTAATGEFSESHQVIDWFFKTVPLQSSSSSNLELLQSSSSSNLELM